MNEQQPVDVEAAPTQALVVHQEHAVTSGLFGTTEPKEVITKAAEVATALKEVVVKQGLVSNINGKQYPRCEAWTLLGTMLGVFPVLVWTKPVEGGWEARVEARTKDGAIVGAAEAECLRKEKNWANRDDFALRSMAQTRATAKCLRMPLGFVMTLSGFEATPAEEMVMDHPQAPQAKKGSQSATPPVKTPPKPSGKQATPEECRAKLAKNMDKAKLREKASQYLIDLAWMMPTESLETLELRYVPLTKERYLEFIKKLTEYAVTGKAEKPYEPNWEAAPSAKPEPTEPPGGWQGAAHGADPAEASEQPWYDVIVPIPHKGQKRDEYLKNPDTIGSLFEARHGTDDESDTMRKRLWGMVKGGKESNWTPKPREYKGKTYQPSEADKQFYRSLKQFSDWFDLNHEGEDL